MSAVSPSPRKRNSPRTPTRRPTHRSGSKRSRRRIGWLAPAILAGTLAIIAIVAWAILARHFAPKSNTALTRFDTIIVLGVPADSDGNPTPMQLARVNEAVREYERGVASRIIFSGGPVANRFPEGLVMAHAAQAEGIPDSAIFPEPHAHDTIQNVCYSERIMDEHGWHSAEVISNDFHIGRAALILSHTPIDWRVRAAPPLKRQSRYDVVYKNALETLKTVRYLLWARQTEKCVP